MVVQRREALERIGRRGVDMAGDAPERQRHQRERQQGDEGQAPVHAQRHDRQHHHQREGAVEAGQHRFAGRHFDRVDVVGGQRHQVAGALLLVEGRALRRQARVEAGAQFDPELVGGGEQAQAPADPQHVDRQAESEQLRQLHPQRHARRGGARPGRRSSRRSCAAPRRCRPRPRSASAPRTRTNANDGARSRRSALINSLTILAGMRPQTINGPKPANLLPLANRRSRQGAYFFLAGFDGAAAACFATISGVPDTGAGGGSASTGLTWATAIGLEDDGTGNDAALGLGSSVRTCRPPWRSGSAPRWAPARDSGSLATTSLGRRHDAHRHRLRLACHWRCWCRRRAAGAGGTSDRRRARRPVRPYRSDAGGDAEQLAAVRQQAVELGLGLAGQREQVARILGGDHLAHQRRRLLERGAGGVEIEGDDFFCALEGLAVNVWKKLNCVSSCDLRASENCSGRGLIGIPFRSFMVRCNIKPSLSMILSLEKHYFLQYSEIILQCSIACLAAIPAARRPAEAATIEASHSLLEPQWISSFAMPACPTAGARSISRSSMAASPRSAPACQLQGAREIDAQGDLVTPPFVDAHFHMDATLSYGLPRVNQSRHPARRDRAVGRAETDACSRTP